MTDHVNKVDESVLIRWETCGADVAQLSREFKEIMNPDTSSDVLKFNHPHEGSVPYRIKFSSGLNTLTKVMQVNPFLQTKMISINNSHVITDVVLAATTLMEDKSEIPFADYIRLQMA